MVANLTCTAEATAKDASPLALPEDSGPWLHIRGVLLFWACCHTPRVLGHLGQDWFQKHSIPWLHVQKVAFISFCNKAWLLSLFIRALFPPSSAFSLLLPFSFPSLPCPALPCPAKHYVNRVIRPTQLTCKL